MSSTATNSVAPAGTGSFYSRFPLLKPAGYCHLSRAAGLTAKYQVLKTPVLLAPAIPILLLLVVALHCQLDQAIDQLLVSHAGGPPQLRVHADGGKAGHGVDLVQIDSAPFRTRIH